MDTMDSFDGLFLEEDLDKMNNDMTPSELETKLDFSVENVSAVKIFRSYQACQLGLSLTTD
jgi:hypothetical protein